MIMVLPTMYRATQNRYEPNLSFAQSLSPTMFRDNQNPDTPNLPFAQRVNPRDTTTVNTQVSTQNTVEGRVNPRDDTTTNAQIPTQNNGLTRSQIENIIESYHGDDIKLLHSHAVNFGNSLSSAKLHRDSIEGKVELGNKQRAEMHTKLSNLGTSVSDVSTALGIHKTEFDLHKTHDLIPNPLGDILPYVLIGGVAYFLLRRKRK